MSSMIEKEPKTPKPIDMELARETSRRLAPLVEEGTDLHLQIRGATTGDLVVPNHAAKMLLDILVQIGRGNAVQLSSLEPEISTQEAAELLNVSRPYVVKLTDEGAIPSRKVGPRRLLKLDDVIAYKRDMYVKRVAVLGELVRISEELGLYDLDAKA